MISKGDKNGTWKVISFQYIFPMRGWIGKRHYYISFKEKILFELEKVRWLTQGQRVEIELGLRPTSCLCLCSVAQLCPTLCDPMDCSLPCSSVHGILQARILGWVASSLSMGSFQLRDWFHLSCVFCIVGRFFTTEPPWNPSTTYQGYFNFISSWQS